MDLTDMPAHTRIMTAISAFICTGAEAFGFPITAFHGSRDRKISADMVAEWRRFTSAAFSQLEIEGHHLWPLDKAAKREWLSRIVAVLAAL
jgi:surfactin synthase thioesterase subunit